MDQNDSSLPTGQESPAIGAPAQGSVRRFFVLTLVAVVAFVGGVVIQATFNPLKPKNPNTPSKKQQPDPSKKPKLSKKKAATPKQEQPNKDAIRLAEMTQQNALLKRKLLEAQQKADHLDKAFDNLSKTAVEQTNEVDRLQGVRALPRGGPDS